MKQCFSLVLMVVAIFLLAGCSSDASQDEYDDGQLFQSGLLAVATGPREWGYINTEGEVVIDFLYDRAGAFRDGVALVQIGNEGFAIDETGAVLFDGMGIHVVSREALNGRLFYRDQETRLMGMMKPDGTFVTEAKYISILSRTTIFYHGTAHVMDIDIPEPLYPAMKADRMKWGVIDENGETVVDFLFDNPLVFHHGLAAHHEEGLYGYVDLTGEFVIEPQYEFAYMFDANGFAMVSTQGEEATKLIDLEGNTVIDGDRIRAFGAGYTVLRGDQHYVYGNDGEPIDGLASIQYASFYYDGSCGMVLIDDASFRVCISAGGDVETKYPTEDSRIVRHRGRLDLLAQKVDDAYVINYEGVAYTLTEGLPLEVIDVGFIIRTDEGIILVDFEGNTLLSSSLSNAYWFKDGYIAVSGLGHGFGIISTDGVEIVPPEYFSFNTSIHP